MLSPDAATTLVAGCAVAVTVGRQTNGRPTEVEL